jgi:uncharacterized protein (DUF2147 family)
MLQRSALLVFTAAIALAVPHSASAQSRQATAAGLWQHAEDGKPLGWFRIIEQGGVYQGQIVKMFPKGQEDPASFRCTKCKGAQKDAPVLGITFIKGMRRNGLRYEDGTILDPRDGSEYRAKMEVSPDNKQLTVRGYVGVSLFGMSQVWHRLPDEALGAAPQNRRRK